MKTAKLFLGLIIMTTILATSALAEVTCSADSTKNIKLGEEKAVSVSCTGLSSSQTVAVEPTSYNANCISLSKTSAQLSSSSSTTTFNVMAISLACQNEVADRTITWTFEPSSGSALASKDSVISITADSSLSAQFDATSYTYEEGGDLTVTLTIFGSGDVDINNIDIAITDNANLDADNGLWDKEVSSLKVSEGTTSTQVSWTLTDMPPMPPGGLSFNASLTSDNAGSGGATASMGTAGDESQFNLSFNGGWSLISFPLNATNMSAWNIFNGVDNLTILWEYNAGSWVAFDPSDQFSLLDTIDRRKGYWAYMSGNDFLTYNGTLVNTTQIDLVSGWNLVGYPSGTSALINNTLVSIISNIVSVWKFDGSYVLHDPLDPFTLLTNFDYGYGYWIKATASGSYNVTGS